MFTNACFRCMKHFTFVVCLTGTLSGILGILGNLLLSKQQMFLSLFLPDHELDKQNCTLRLQPPPPPCQNKDTIDKTVITRREWYLKSIY